MTGKTHVIAGLTTGVFLGLNAPQLIFAAFGALLPDIDHEHSTLGHHVPFISKHLSHRGFTHSIVFLLICTAISPYLGIGIMTHIILDTLNTVGVQMLWPLKKKIKIPVIAIHTGKIVEKILFILCIPLLAIGIGWYHYRFGILSIMEYTTVFWQTPDWMSDLAVQIQNFFMEGWEYVQQSTSQNYPG